MELSFDGRLVHDGTMKASRVLATAHALSRHIMRLATPPRARVVTRGLVMNNRWNLADLDMILTIRFLAKKLHK